METEKTKTTLEALKETYDFLIKVNLDKLAWSGETQSPIKENYFRFWFVCKDGTHIVFDVTDDERKEFLEYYAQNKPKEMKNDIN